MRVIQQTSDRLILQERPWLLWFLGSVFTIVGAMVFTLIGETVTFQCDRSLTPPACTLINQKLLTQRSITLPLQSLQQAEIQSSRRRKGKRTYRVLLRTDSGGIPLVTTFSNISNHSAQARQINDFLQNPSQPTLEVTGDYRWLALLFLVAFSGPGMLMLLLGKIVTLDLNKQTGECTLQRRGLFGQHQRHYPLRDIRRVWIERSRKNTTYRVNLDLRSGETVHLMPYLSSGYQDKERLRNRLCDFLNLAVDPS
ncbi:hypothetical protein [Trichothermofontia sp.]